MVLLWVVCRRHRWYKPTVGARRCRPASCNYRSPRPPLSERALKSFQSNFPCSKCLVFKVFRSIQNPTDFLNCTSLQFKSRCSTIERDHPNWENRSRDSSAVPRAGFSQSLTDEARLSPGKGAHSDHSGFDQTRASSCFGFSRLILNSSREGVQCQYKTQWH